MKHWFFLGIALTFLILAGVISLFFSDIDASRYNTYTEAKTDSALKRGWLPKCLPESAYNIFEKHNIDTNEGEGYFYYRKKDEPALLEALKHTQSAFLFEVLPAQNLVRFYHIPKEK